MRARLYAGLLRGLGFGFGYAIGRSSPDGTAELQADSLARQIRHVARMGARCHALIEDHWKAWPHSEQPGSADMVEASRLQRRSLEAYGR